MDILDMASEAEQRELDALIARQAASSSVVETPFEIEGERVCLGCFVPIAKKRLTPTPCGASNAKRQRRTPVEWFEWVKVIASVVMFIVTGLMAVIAYLGKKMIDGFGQELREMRQEHDDLEKDFLKFQAQLPRNYVLKDDHIRHITIVENKIDEHARTTRHALASIESDIKLLLRETPKRKTDA
jgi:hypothetical protein